MATSNPLLRGDASGIVLRILRAPGKKLSGLLLGWLAGRTDAVRAYEPTTHTLWAADGTTASGHDVGLLKAFVMVVFVGLIGALAAAIQLTTADSQTALWALAAGHMVAVCVLGSATVETFEANIRTEGF